MLRSRTIPYLAAAWAFAFAAMSFYWALGGRFGIETIGPGIATLGDDPLFVLIGLWGAGFAKATGGCLALAFARRWGSDRLRRLLGWLALVGGVLVALYGAASLIQHASMVLGLTDTPEGLGPTAARWHLVLWDPWWLIGGLLFAAIGRAESR